MNAKTLEAVTRHGKALLAAFPGSIEKDPVALCKKLRRIETSLNKPLVDYCNGTESLENVDDICDSALLRVYNLLGFGRSKVITNGHLFINRDPRGYALKLDDAWTMAHNGALGTSNTPRIYTDMGGYGIIAPDLTQ